MNVQTFAKELNLSVADAKLLLSDLGVDPSSDIPEMVLEMALQAQGKSPKTIATPSPNTTQDEPKKRSKRGGKLTQKATEQLEQTNATTATVTDSIETKYLELQALEGLSLAEKGLAVKVAALRQGKAKGEAAMMQWLTDCTHQQISHNAESFDLDAILTQVGATSATESMGKGEVIAPDFSLVGEIAATLPWN